MTGLRAQANLAGAASGCGLRLHLCGHRCDVPYHGLYALRAGKEPKDNEAVDALLPNITLEFAFIEGEQHIYLNGEDVSTAIRTEEVGMAASAVGANPAVRAFLLEMQRDMAKTQNILMDGRDIGTVCCPMRL